MGYRESAELAEFPGFRNRVLIAVMGAAKDVAAETGDGSERYRLRRALAMNVFADPERYCTVFSWAVVTNPVITFTSADGDIQFTVNSLWDGIAGASQPPEQ